MFHAVPAYNSRTQCLRGLFNRRHLLSASKDVIRPAEITFDPRKSRDHARRALAGGEGGRGLFRSTTFTPIVFFRVFFLWCGIFRSIVPDRAFIDVEPLAICRLLIGLALSAVLNWLSPPAPRGDEDSAGSCDPALGQLNGDRSRAGFRINCLPYFASVPPWRCPRFT